MIPVAATSMEAADMIIGVTGAEIFICAIAAGRLAETFIFTKLTAAPTQYYLAPYLI
jgi:hypothetical protein